MDGCWGKGILFSGYGWVGISDGAPEPSRSNLKSGSRDGEG